MGRRPRNTGLTSAVFRALGGGPGTVAEVSARAGSDPRTVRGTLERLAAAGLLGRSPPGTRPVYFALPGAALPAPRRPPVPAADGLRRVVLYLGALAPGSPPPAGDDLAAACGLTPDDWWRACGRCPEVKLTPCGPLGWRLTPRGREMYESLKESR